MPVRAKSIEIADIGELRERLGAAASVQDYPERHLKIAAVLTQALATVGVAPILVGGGAIEFYTAGAYSTGDVDLIAPEGKEVAVVLSSLGFEKRGQNWTHGQLQIFVEFPAKTLRAGEEFIVVTVEGVAVKVVSPEDLVVERLRSFKLYGATADAVNALLILGSTPEFDHKRAAKRASKEEVRDAYDGLSEILRRIERGLVASESANGMLEALLKKIRL